jgi:hypothetical protein
MPIPTNTESCRPKREEDTLEGGRCVSSRGEGFGGDGDCGILGRSRVGRGGQHGLHRRHIRRNLERPNRSLLKS